jgi:uncharacterized repeat protein (TIGR01451 family)
VSLSTAGATSGVSGLHWQWQSSSDSITWTNIGSDTFSTANVVVNASAFYRASLTCIPSGFTSYSNVVYVTCTGIHIAGISLNFGDTACASPTINTNISGYASGLSVTTFYGDGTFNTHLVTGTGGSCHVSIVHAYSYSGDYTIKQLLYLSGSAIDSATIFGHYTLCSGMTIRYYYDANGNCVLDGSESDLMSPSLTEISLNGVPIDTISSIGGFHYHEVGSTGDIFRYRWLSTVDGSYPSCPLTGVLFDTLHALAVPAVSQLLGFICPSSAFDVSEHAIIPVTGRHDQWGNIYVQNGSCQVEPVTLTLNFSPKYVYTGGAHPTPILVTSTSIVWNVSGLVATAAHPAHFYYQVWSPSGTYLTIGDTVHESISVSPTVGDSDTSNNHETIIDTVKAGCDPNHISVSPTWHTNAGDQLKYTVQFMNTGNDTAFNIYVLDTLSDNLDVSTLRLTFTTEPHMYTSKYTDGAGHTIMKYEFPGINLLDSSHHDACTAMFGYNINSKPGLPECTLIPARVGIYFDYNEVVMTNEVKNIIGCYTDVELAAKAATDLYPNPATDQLTLKTDASTYHSFTIINTLGEVVYQHAITANTTQISTGTLPAGVYNIPRHGDSGVVVKRVVIVR